MGIAAVAAPVISVINACSKDDNDDPHCGLTDEATSGPFYVPGAPTSVQLNFQNAAGTPMAISGTVYGGDDGETPLSNVRVEAWHADDKGVYWPADNKDYSSYDPTEVNLRGIGNTNDKGIYAFNSIRPGLYTGRRRHIHWYAVADDHKAIFTQSYWLDEKGTEVEAKDGVDTKTEDCRYVDFKDDGNGGVVGVFDIYLEKK